MAGEDEEIDAQGDDEDQQHGSEGDGDQGAEDGEASEADLSTEHADDAEDGGQSQVAPRSRGEQRIQRLANEAREAKEKAERAERRLQELESRNQFGQNQQTEQQERERLALMTPEERAEYRISRHEQTTQARIAQSEFRTADLVDRASFDAKAALNKVYSRYAPEVEKRLQELRREGQNIPREQLLRWIIGNKALESAGAPAKPSAGKQRVAAQRATPTNSKGDTASSRGKQATSAEARLKDQII
jgi:hypothetical protein